MIALIRCQPRARVLNDVLEWCAKSMRMLGNAMQSPVHLERGGLIVVQGLEKSISRFMEGKCWFAHVMLPK